ncbi:MAG: low molecular weight phosphotyrosine protein phosphatase [Thiolinea sp.]
MFEQLVNQRGLGEFITIDSAGTHAYHIGESPDRRSQAAAADRGVDLSRQRARQVSPEDFVVLIICWRWIRPICAIYNVLPSRGSVPVPVCSWSLPSAGRGKCRPLVGTHGFDRVLDMVEDASADLLEHLLRRVA